MPKFVQPPEYVKGGAIYPYSDRMAQKMTMLSRFGDQFEMFHRLPQVNRIIVPRQCAPMPVGEQDQRADGVAYEFQNNFVPRFDEQQELVDRSTMLLQDDQSHILQADTGYGKTYLGCAIAARLKTYTCVITTKEDIIGDWAKAAREVLGLTNDQIGVWQGDSVCNVKLINKPFVIALVQSALKGPGRYRQAAYNPYGLVICDEVHRMGADQFSKAMWWFPAKLRLGLSATPERKDGKDVVFLSHIGPVKVRGDIQSIKVKVLIRGTDFQLPRNKGDGKKMKHAPGRTMHVSKILAKDGYRNYIIANFVRQAVDKGRVTIVFCDTMKHLVAIYERCIDAGVAPQKLGYYVGLQAYEGTKEERTREREAAKLCPVILATYQMASEATNIPWADTAVLASPRADVVQIVGRIRREYPDKKEPVVFDLVDGDSFVFRGYRDKRLKWYVSQGFEIVDVTPPKVA